MRPDLDDYEELNMGEGSSRARAMSWLVLLVAIGGFTSLAYYAYKSGSQAMRESTITVVNAEETPIKSAPTDPQGEQFPNKDKTIYDAIAQDGKGTRVEKLMPEPERATIPESMEEDGPATANEDGPSTKATTYVKSADKVAGLTTTAAPAAKADPAPAPAAVASKSVETAKSETAAKTDPSAATAPGQEKSAAAPEMVNIKPVTTVSKPSSEVKDDEAQSKASAKKSAPAKPVAAPASGGAYKVQLGAYQSEAEAQSQWNRIRAKNSDVLSGDPIIVKADTDKGTFYRLRISGFASSDAAKAACAKLAARRQACFPAGK